MDEGNDIMVEWKFWRKGAWTDSLTDTTDGKSNTTTGANLTESPPASITDYKTDSTYNPNNLTINTSATATWPKYAVYMPPTSPVEFDVDGMLIGIARLDFPKNADEMEELLKNCNDFVNQYKLRWNMEMGWETDLFKRMKIIIDQIAKDYPFLQKMCDYATAVIVVTKMTPKEDPKVTPVPTLSVLYNSPIGARTRPLGL